MGRSRRDEIRPRGDGTLIAALFDNGGVALGKAGYVRVVWSKGLVHGLGGGFAFIIRPDRLIGSKKVTRRTKALELRELIFQDPQMTRPFLPLAVRLPPG